jgi:uncharacterized protein YozE (UPF0346 family)
MNEITFYEFLMGQLDRDDPIGDLANDAKRKNDAPKGKVNYEIWCGHLIRNRACSEALDALKEAWYEYQSENNMY